MPSLLKVHKIYVNLFHLFGDPSTKKAAQGSPDQPIFTGIETLLENKPPRTVVSVMYYT